MALQSLVPREIDVQIAGTNRNLAKSGLGLGWYRNTCREIGGPFANRSYSCVFVNHPESILLAGSREFWIVVITSCSPGHPHRSLTRIKIRFK